MLRVFLALIFAVCCGPLRAHTVPIMVVEAEFSASRELVLKVNLDPRLFLSPLPTSLPPVPASWWFEQDEAGKAKTMQAAGDYVQKNLTLRVGSAVVSGTWKVQPVDSASAFPLGQASTEVHLLAEHRGPLPDATGDFKVSVSKECAVAVILLCSNVGDAERNPQSLFPGETSRGFPLPPPAQAASASAPSATSGAEHTGFSGKLAWFTRNAHFFGDHLALAALLAFGLQRCFWRAAGLLFVFHAGDMLSACLVMMGWFPSAPTWMQIAYWIALALTAFHLFVAKQTGSNVLVTLAVAGVLHGLNTPHLNLDSSVFAPATILFGQAGVLLAAELMVLAACAAIMRMASRRRGQVSLAVTA